MNTGSIEKTVLKKGFEKYIEPTCKEVRSWGVLGTVKVQTYGKERDGFWENAKQCSSKERILNKETGR